MALGPDHSGPGRQGMGLWPISQTSAGGGAEPPGHG